MNKDEKEELIRQFLEGELDSQSDEEAALRIMAEEEEYRELLHFELYLNRTFNRGEAEADSFSVPEDFSDQVMQAIEKREQEAGARTSAESESKISEWVKEKVQRLLEPRPVQWRPAYGLAAVVAVIALIVSLDLGTQVFQKSDQRYQQVAQSDLKQQVKQQQAVKVASVRAEKNKRVWGRFFYVNNEAESVAVAGDFSNWEPIPLDKREVNGETVWTNTIQMKRGEHRYMYIVNGNKWRTDPLANRYKKDGFGNRNAIINL